MDEFEKFKIKEYRNWDLYLHQAQFPFIGRCYAWAKRENAVIIEDIRLREGVELIFGIIPKWSMVISKLYHHDLSNLGIYGNTARHLHAHLIPRYNHPRNFHGIEFIDPNPNGNYSPYPKKEISMDILLKIRDEIKSKI